MAKGLTHTKTASTILSTTSMPPIQEDQDEEMLLLDDETRGDATTITTFTYPMWEQDQALVEKTLSTYPNALAQKFTRQKLRAMRNKQYLHECSAKLHPGIAKIQKPGAYTYDGVAQDIKEVFKQYMLGHDKIVDRLVSAMDIKQGIYGELESFTFCYPGWKDDKGTVEEIFTASDQEGTYHDARNMLKEMKRKQQVFEEEGFPPGITLLHSEVFSYPSFENDKEAALDLYDRGDEEAFEQLLARIQSKQTFHDGCRDHPLLVELDSTEFSYPGWREDRILVEDTLMHSVNAFAEYDAERLLKGMKNKQRLFTGNDLHPGIVALRSRTTFTYKGFKRDKLDAIREYRAGYDSAFEERLVCINEKQKQHDVNHTDLALVSPTSSSSPSPTSRKVSFSDEDVKSVVTPTDDAKSMSSSNIERVSTKDVERFVPEDCVICLSAPRTHIFAPCGHLCLCNQCAFKTPYRKRKKSKKTYCPICRQESTSIVKVYF